MEMFLESIVRGYHVYRRIWEAVVGEELTCITEPDNRSDRYAVAVIKSDTTVGHVPRKFSAVCALFLNRGGTMICKVTGERLYSRDLPQGGMEIPCRYIFRGQSTDIEKVKKVFNLVFSDADKNIPTMIQSSVKIAGFEPVGNKRKVEEVQSSEEWLVFESVYLDYYDKQLIINGSELNDKHITFGLRLLKHQFQHINGLQSTLLQQSANVSPFLGGGNALQVIHCYQCHWLVASSINIGGTAIIDKDDVLIYDSLYNVVDENTIKLLERLFGRKIMAKMQCLQKQSGSKDCGLFALAVSTALAHCVDPTKIRFDQSNMRQHLLTCYENKRLSMFPML